MRTNHNQKNYKKGLRRKLFVSAFLFISFNGYTTDYYVNDASLSNDLYCTATGAGANDGLTASTPKASLTQIWSTYGPGGTNVITSGDNIYVDAGTYLATDANIALSVDGISIIGAGLGLTFFDNNQTSTDANRWANITGNNITLTGFYLTGYNYGFGDANVMMITGVSNLTVNNVMINENLPGGGSTAIVINGGSSVTFNGGGSSCNPGAASVAGGGVNVEGNGNTVTFNNYQFSSNEKDYEGGSGLKVTGNATTSVDVNDCLFSDNINNSSSGGGAIFIANGATITIDGSEFNNNFASQTSSTNYGGAICIGRGSTATITSCTFDGNTATSSGNGGSVAVNTGLGSTGSAAAAIIDACTFTNGSGNDGADIMGRVSFSRAATLTVTNVTWSGTAEDIKNDNSATITVSNSGSPSFSGSVSFPNNSAPLSSPTTNAPTSTGCFSALPVELSHFSGFCRDNDNILQWTTNSEINNDYFIIERLNENGEFEVLEYIDGVGTTNFMTNYEWIDERPLNITSYYRLSQVDFDGKRETFETISVKQNCVSNGPIYSVIHDEINNQLIINYSIDQRESVQVHMTDAMGKSIVLESVDLPPTKHTVRIELNNELNTGIYYINIVNQSVRYSGKLITL